MSTEHKSPLQIRKMPPFLWGLCEKIVIQLDNQSRKERTQPVYTTKIFSDQLTYIVVNRYSRTHSNLFPVCRTKSQTTLVLKGYSVYIACRHYTLPSSLEPWPIGEYLIFLTVAINMPCVRSYIDTNTRMSKRPGVVSTSFHTTLKSLTPFFFFKKEKSKQKVKDIGSVQIV